jgi:copper chaperone CopZ
MQSLVLSIEGMSCGHCLNAVSRALSETAGVAIKSVRIGRAELDFDPAKVEPGGIIAAIGKAGYPAAPIS